MQRIVLDALKMQNPETAQEYLKEKFQLPVHYGCNLDALYDCLSEIAEETEVMLSGITADMIYPQKVLKVLCDVQAENEDFSVNTE